MSRKKLKLLYLILLILSLQVVILMLIYLDLVSPQENFPRLTVADDGEYKFKLPDPRPRVLRRRMTKTIDELLQEDQELQATPDLSTSHLEPKVEKWAQPSLQRENDPSHYDKMFKSKLQTEHWQNTSLHNTYSPHSIRDVDKQKVSISESKQEKEPAIIIRRPEPEVVQKSQRRGVIGKLWTRSQGVTDLKQKHGERNNVRSTHAPLSLAYPAVYFREVCNKTLEPLVECSNKTMPRKLSPFEESGGDIMFTMRTTVSYHETRLPVLLETWLGDMEPGNVFLVTDGGDEDLEWKLNDLGMHYVNVEAGKSHNRSDLCCKAGMELEQLFSPENSKFNWLCHVDDDMYVNLMPLVNALSHFDPVKDKVYFGRSGSPWDKPRVVKNSSLIGTPGRRFHFAVGGFYCLSRALLVESQPYLVGCKAFQDSCQKAREPEDVTVGLIIGAVLNKGLQRTEMVYTHGLDLLSHAPTFYLKHQIAFSYGFGADDVRSAVPNAVYVPGGLFNIDEDITQFKSLHCHLYPTIEWCLEKEKLEKKRQQRQKGLGIQCDCSWNKIICCRAYMANAAKQAQVKREEYKKQLKRTTITATQGTRDRHR